MTIRLDIPARYPSLNILDACLTEMLGQLEELSNPGITINDIRVAVQEACISIVSHADPHQPDGRIAVTLTLHERDRSLVVELCDTGCPIDVAGASLAVPDPETIPDPSFGLFLLHALMDDVTYEPQPGNNTWRLVKHLT
ncbi:MAG: ATP-binding protein [Chloroflexaceae bacterium]|nr:ATP-binding protein [Chloroflexaceae bacterium]